MPASRVQSKRIRRGLEQMLHKKTVVHVRNALATYLAMFFIGCARPDARPDHPYDFKGISLGISQAEMRRLPWPDSGTNVRLVCTGDTDSLGIPYPRAFEISGPLGEIGATACVYEAERGSPYYPGTAGLGMGGGRYVSYDHIFWFIPSPSDNVARLYQIYLPTNTDAEYDVIEALSAKFGNAATTETNALQNGFGATFQGRISIWHNSESTITVRAPDHHVDQMTVTYTHIRLWNYVGELLARRQSSIPNRM